MNYRLGILGYLALPELRDPQANLTVGNWGLLDQRLALQWVRDNIGAFGGDPKKVVLSGESAGAYSTLLHLVAPGSKGLFSAAASFSGSADAMAVDFLRDAYRKGSTLRTTLNCSSSNALARGYASTGDCLRAVDADTLLAVQDEISSRTVDSFIPTIDGIFMPRHPVRLMQLGNATKVPVLLGVNANEGALEVLGQTRGLDPIDVEGFFTVVNSLIPISPSFNERLYQQYNADEYYGGSWLLSAINVITDGGYHCPSRRVAKLLSAQGLTVRYHILQASKPNTGCPLFVTTGLFFGEEFTNFMDAFHSYDIPFTFLAPYRYPFNQCPFTPNETQLASYLSGIINAMAATGSPLPPRTSSLTSRLLKNTPSWKPWTATSNPVMNIDTAGPRVFEAADLLLDAKCQFWDDLLNADITAGTAFHS
ncbi:hypothetical protein VOLCADRAFT_102615 [Volvox carteri f. nagariensis]|uniref:Carboxylic ester hydrolase n=1 Tax=Volvox carteri f. nagariensis TaxID=3068 RepID=D8TH30_VOLCA|nr:uncharacterized protein VOLCADRAFT_102615 [Volvox carteri f. nagariensis]EFJ53001.1 hypothetical protein VOLCADRAFT_102615 [Volvox carteri f. nagariensis]|eukprot:XP_002946006.1 hypothetical protein VOLCADRAFT_102615 [Volvox carteri f. nagariensis]